MPSEIPWNSILPLVGVLLGAALSGGISIFAQHIHHQREDVRSRITYEREEAKEKKARALSKLQEAISLLDDARLHISNLVTATVNLEESTDKLEDELIEPGALRACEHIVHVYAHELIDRLEDIKRTYVDLLKSAHAFEQSITNNSGTTDAISSRLLETYGSLVNQVDVLKRSLSALIISKDLA